MVSLNSLLSYNTAMKKAETVSNLKDNMHNRTNILKEEIKLDSGRSCDTSLKQDEVNSLNSKIDDCYNNLGNTVSDINKEMTNDPSKTSGNTNTEKASSNKSASDTKSTDAKQPSDSASKPSNTDTVQISKRDYVPQANNIINKTLPLNDAIASSLYTINYCV